MATYSRRGINAVMFGIWLKTFKLHFKMLDLAKSKINFDKSLTFYLHVLKGKPACIFDFDSLKCMVFYQATKTAPNHLV